MAKNLMITDLNLNHTEKLENFEEAIKFVLDYYKNLKHYGDLSLVSNFIEPIHFVEQSFVNSFLIRHNHELLKMTPTLEQDYLCWENSSLVFRTKITFGVVEGKRAVKKYTEKIYFKKNDSTDFSYRKKGPCHFEISLSIFHGSASLVTLTRSYGPTIDYSSKKIKIILFYSVSDKEAVQNFKCNYVIKREKMEYFKYITLKDEPSQLQMNVGLNLRAPEVVKALGKASENLTSVVGDACEKLSQALSGMPDKIGDLASKKGDETMSFFQKAGGVTLVVLLSSFVLDYHFNNVVPSKKMALTVGVIAAGLYGPEILTTLGCLFEKQADNSVPQLGFETPGIVIKCFDMILNYIPTMKKLKDYVYLITNFERLKDGCLSIFQWIFEQIDKMCLYIIERRVIPVSWYTNTMSNNSILHFSDRVKSFKDDLVSCKIRYDTPSYLVVKDLVSECLELRLEVPKSSGAGVVLDRCYKELDGLCDTFGIMDSTVAGYRQEPVCVSMYGSPGTNKSTLVQLLVQRLYKEKENKSLLAGNYVGKRKILSAEQRDELNSFVFFRDIGTKYWDGYKGQDVTCYDDFAQKKDIVGSEDSDYFELLRAINTIPYHLHMADIADKKNTYFKSKFVFLTTNVRRFAPESLHDARAINRRVHISLLVTPKAKYCEDPRVEYSMRKFDKNLNGGKPMDFTPDHFDIYLRKLDPNGEDLLTPVSFDQVYRMMMEKQDFFKGCMEMNANSAKRFADQSEDLYTEFGFSMEDKVSLVSKFSSVDDIDPKFSQIRDFMSFYCAEYGIPGMSHKEFFKRSVSKHDKNMMIDILGGKNFDLWAKKAYEELDVVSDIQMESMRLMDEACCPDKSVALKVREFLLDHKVAITVGTIILSGIALYKSQSSPSDMQSPTSVTPHKPQQLKSIAELRSQLSVPQMGITEDPNCDAIADSVLQRNSFGFFVEGKQAGMITFIGSTMAIMPSHFLIGLGNEVNDPTVTFNLDSIIEIRSNRKMDPGFTHFKISFGEMVDNMVTTRNLEANDIVGIIFPDRFPRQKNIIQHFKERKSLKNIINTVVNKMAFHARDGIETITQISRANKKLGHEVFWYGFDENGRPNRKVLDSCYKCDMATMKGHCGALYFEINPKATRKIIGIHTAGTFSQKEAICAVTCSEDLQEMYDVANSYKVLLTDLNEEASVVQMNDVLGSKFDVVCDSVLLNSVTKTTIIAARSIGLFQEPTMYPAILTPKMKEGVLIDIHEKALEGYNTNSGVFICPKLLDQVVDSEVDFYSRNRKFDVEARVLDNEEIFLGIQDECDFSPMSRTTSPGADGDHIFVNERKGMKGKALWFGTESEYDLTNEHYLEFMDIINQYEEQLSEGIIPRFLFIDNLKDELRPSKKVLELSTRNFSASSMALVFLFKKYFGSFMTLFIKNRIKFGHTIGINPYGPEWDSLVRYLHEVNRIVNAGDFKSFDKKQASMIVSVMLPIIEDFYKETSTIRERLIRRCLWTTLTVTYHLYNGKIVKWVSGLCSGHPMTAIINSMYNRIVHKLCFYDLCRIDKLDNYELLWDFNDKVHVCPHGDDSLMTASVDYADKYNEKTLPQSMIKLGLTYTPETKEVLNGKLRTIEEVAYLKRNFRYERSVGRYVAPLNKERILEMPNWTKKVDGESILRDKFDVVAREISLHGKSIAEPIISRLNNKSYELFGEGLKKSTYNALLVEALNSRLVPMVSNLQMTMTYTTENQLNKALNSLSLGAQPITITENISFLQMDSAPTTATVSEPSKPSTDVIFEDDGVVSEEIVPLYKRSTRLLVDFENKMGVHDIKRILQRPVVISSGSFASTDVASTFPKYDWTLPLTGSTMFLNKMLGIFQIRADIKYTLDFNSNMHQQGLYAVAFIYSGGMTGNSSNTTNWNLMHGFSPYQISQLPIVYANLGCETKVTLTVPWKSAMYGYYPNTVNPTYTSPGVARLYPFVPVNSTSGTATVPYVLWANYENIELGAASYPQMGNKSKKLDLLSAEQEDRPVSKTLTTLSQVAGALSTVPLLSSIATPLSWMLDASARAAKAWGFSKPNTIEQPCRMVRSIMPYMACSDGHDMSEPLSMTRGNHVEFGHTEMGCEADEMSLAYFCQKPSYIANITWNTTGNPKDYLLGDYIVNPAAMKSNVSDGAVTLVNHSPVSFVSQWFNLWRGSLIFKVRIAKTKFHSGRLLITFNPQDTIGVTAAPTVDTTASQYMYRNIIDVREMDEFEFTIPYIYDRPWCTTEATDRTGILSIVVLDPLTAPAVVPSTIQLIVEVRGGPDLAFAAPTGISATPIVPSALQMDTCMVKKDNIGGTTVVDGSLEAKSLTQGEDIVSWRQYIKRYMPFVDTPGISATTNTYTIPPFASYQYTSNGTVVAGTSANISRDLFSHLNTIYAFNRGGVRIMVMPETTNTTQIIYASLDFVNKGAGTLASLVVSSVASITNFLYTTNGQGLTTFITNAPNPGVFIPQSTNGFHRLSGMNIVTSTNAISYTANLTDLTQLKVHQEGGAAITFNTFRSGADDISFGCFVSIPPYYQDATPA